MEHNGVAGCGPARLHAWGGAWVRGCSNKRSFLPRRARWSGGRELTISVWCSDVLEHSYLRFSAAQWTLPAHGPENSPRRLY